jgi:predicted nuclease of predicted toxin-antitoxin system
MRFLADESCDFALVRALCSDGRDVAAVSEFQQRSVDRQIMEMAYNEGRILLTEDKDFGWLAFVGHLDNPGVILIRFPAAGHPSPS